MDEEELEESARLSPENRIIANSINMHYCGELLSMSEGRAEVELITRDDMEVDSGVIHIGFIHSAAAFGALCAINKKNSIIIGSNVKFLAPVETNQRVIFKAKTLQDNIRKCEVRVEGFVLDIKIFDGLFYIVIFDKKLFRLKLKDNQELE